jgi:hypothetical protein
MSSFTDYLEDALLDMTFGQTAFTSVATIYFAALTTNINDASTSGSISPGVEATGGSYARKSETNNKTLWSNSSGGSIQNDAAVTWVTASGGNWGDIVAVAIADVASGAGDFYCYDDFSAVTINDGDTLEIAIAGMTISLT